ncbi:hypothetical protein [Thalassobius sp. Cn5-15]|uniref:hypothetical protein n=1 Tax=Thalassobius sp. Cn5-15 TaxID=2917763 RepID=UPI001EF311D0|nr:hypothetical protein [Thalassobius sp. Cn5-15]MCG7494416.1 hypothetical protein [Thalassobius sp. Cn5-15]
MFRKLTGKRSAPGLTVIGSPPRTIPRSAQSVKSPRFNPLPRLRGNSCDWVSEGAKNASFTQYRCTTCGVEAFSRTGKAPRQCKRGVEGGL